MIPHLPDRIGGISVGRRHNDAMDILIWLLVVVAFAIGVAGYGLAKWRQGGDKGSLEWWQANRRRQGWWW